MSTITEEQTTDVAAQLTQINEKLDRLSLVMEDLGRRMESFDDLKEDLVPIAHGALKIAYKQLHELEQQGALEFASESIQVAKTIATSFSRDDVKLLGDNVVKILETVRNLTQPGVLNIADRAATALQEAPEEGRIGLIRAMRDPEIRKGMALLFAVLRELGSSESGNGADSSSKATGSGGETIN